MSQPQRTVGPVQHTMAKFWEMIFRQNRSLLMALPATLVMGTLSFLLIDALFRMTGHYYNAISVVTVGLITLFSGPIPGLVLTVILSLLADYFFIPPIGSILDTHEGIQHLIILCTISIGVTALNSSLRRSFLLTEQAKHQAERALLARDEMVGIISHELKNPLTAIQTGSLVLQRLLQKDPALDDARMLVARMIPSVNRMNRLISDLLDVTQLEGRALKVNPQVVDLFDIVREVLSSHLASAQEKLIQLRSDIQPGSYFISCDPDRIAQVLVNLVNNALKFTNAGGLIRIHAARVKESVEIQVTDTGKGISKENLPRIFDRFWQAKDTAYTGTGLGLAISKGLVEAHGGAIWAESQIGAGSTFHFTLRSAVATQSTASKAAAS